MMNPIEEILNQMFSPMLEKAMTDEQIESLRNEQLQREKMLRAQSRMDSMDAPKRLMVNRDTLKKDNDWGRAAASLKKLIGTGAILVLRGKPGTGKTQLAVELMIHGIMEKDLPARFETFSRIQMNIKKAFNEKTGENGVIKKLLSYDILTIDEFDWIPSNKENATDDYWQQIIYHVINERYNNMQDTILTSNKTAEAFAATTLVQIKSRIAETGGMVSTDDWIDWRMR